MSEPYTNDSTQGLPQPTRSRWPLFAVTTLLVAGAIFILTPTQLRFFQGLDQHRESILAKPETRDFLTSATYFREMNRQLPLDTKIFFCGVIGTNKPIYPYFFARTFLFPHDVEISLDHNADYHADGFRGVDCFSPGELLTNGYDLIMMFGTNDGSIMTLPLTEKGVLKQ